MRFISKIFDVMSVVIYTNFYLKVKKVTNSSPDAKNKLKKRRLNRNSFLKKVLTSLIYTIYHITQFSFSELGKSESFHV